MFSILGPFGCLRVLQLSSAFDTLTYLPENDIVPNRVLGRWLAFLMLGFTMVILILDWARTGVGQPRGRCADASRAGS